VWPPEAASKLSSRHSILHLHGMLASGDDPYLMLEAATDQASVRALREDVAIIGLDRPGFANSSAPHARPDLLMVARDLAALAAALELSSWSVTGASPLESAVRTQWTHVAGLFWQATRLAVPLPWRSPRWLRLVFSERC